MKKLFAFTLLAMILSVASFASTIIFGPSVVCTGSKITLYDSTTGGVWSSGNTAVATINATTGEVTGISSGTATITYTLMSTYATTTVTVSTSPSAISGTPSLCVGASYTFTDATPGGIWSCYSSYVATVGSTSGVVTGSHGGIATVYYTMPGGCAATTTVTINPLPVVSLVGPITVCVGSTITITDTTGGPGSTWSSSNTSVATVSGGIVSGISAGTAVISCSATNSCGTTTATRTITVTSTITPASITGPSSVMATSSVTLYDATTGGTWSSGTPSVATVGSSSGIVTGVSAGTAIITYTVKGCSGPAYVVYTITVTAFDGISGDVLFTGPAYSGPVKVWLIHYDPSTLDLQAYDSTYTYSTGASAHYSFTGVPTDSFRVKAATEDTPVKSTGYIPSYHTASFYWYSATVIPHISGTSDVNKDITMSYGTVTPGPGFVGGNVSTGANKGTSGGYAIGLTMYLLDASGKVVMHTETDASGNFSFSGLPLGTYSVFPESLNYLTTPYTGISLTSGAPSESAASFVQHTISMTITPNIALNNKTQASATSVLVFPNPSNGKLNISWNVATAENGTVSLTDVTGREVYSNTVNMNAGSGIQQFDLSALTSGLYVISVRSTSINYTSKMTVTH